MMNFIRAGMVVVLGLGLNVLCVDAWADEDPSEVTQTSEGSAAAMKTDSLPDESMAGAGSAEPADAVEEDPGAGAHKAWVESIWSSP